jgi:uncharacterized SAM-binding protein YcdF (DUF218 family)
MIEWLMVLPGVLVTGWVGAAAALDAYGRRPHPPRTYDALVVAGCRVFPDGRPSAALVRRVRLAVDLYHRGVAERIVLTGGVGRDAPLSEARAAGLLCERLGVPGHHLVLEEESTSTIENAAFAARLVRGHVLVVSDAAHAFRCRRMFARHFERVDVVGVIPPRGPRVRLALREVFAVVRHATLGNL